MRDSRASFLGLLAGTLLVGCGGLPPMRLDEEHKIGPGIYGTRYFQQESHLSDHGYSVYFIENRSELPLCAMASGDAVIVQPGQNWRIGTRIGPPPIRLADAPENRDCKSLAPEKWKVGIR